MLERHSDRLLERRLGCLLVTCVRSLLLLRGVALLLVLVLGLRRFVAHMPSVRDASPAKRVGAADTLPARACHCTVLVVVDQSGHAVGGRTYQ